MPKTVVDIHCHTAGLGAGGSGCFVSPSLRRNLRLPLYFRAFGVSEREVRERGDERVIEKLAEGVAASREVTAAVILALDAVVERGGAVAWDATEICVPNGFVAAAVAARDNLRFGASVHPWRTDALQRLEQVAAQGAVLVKWLPPIQHIDPADRGLVRYYEKLAELNLPLLCHSGQERSFSRSRDALGDPERLRLALETGVRVIAAHGAAAGRSDGQRNLERWLGLARRFPNLYADISSLTQLNHPGALRRLLAAPEIRERLLYGSDMPLINTALVSPWFFVLRIGWQTAREIQRMRNPWDRDVALKRSLGVPDDVFARSAALLRDRG